MYLDIIMQYILNNKINVVMRLLTDSVEADEGYVSTTQQPTMKKPKNNLIRRQQQNINSIHSSESPSSDESSMSSSPSPADYVFDIMYHDQQASLSMLDIKDPFYEPFFNSSLDMPATDNSNTTAAVGGMAASATSSSFSTDVLQQLFNSSTDLLADQCNAATMMKQQKKQQKKRGVTKKYNKKQKNIMKTSNTMPMANQQTTILPSSTSSIWIDPSIYPLWPNYICLYLEYSLPYDPSVSCLFIIACILYEKN
jgi:hypothetical protein